ncbi:putative E3 ubiquitin-protein ligase HECTD1 [Paratrimastix pyriformis]|uniref:E3 ubiquitin-protein ligase HECTD1 n=1 Tax=Paratrimastix pyriformis TaxID=342808 RepID=A0ABQ8UJR2_9EUKA|nr:putative E3 ubiquitin-protein ligase HECTD1 [Paratrimastix pyriformis]
MEGVNSHATLNCDDKKQSPCRPRKQLDYVIPSGRSDDETWRCPACFSHYEDPVVLSCGDTVCRACVEVIRDSCPKCCKKFNAEQLYPSRIAERQVPKMQCHCPNRGLGCAAVIGVLDVEHHLGAECEWREEECDQCHQQVRRAEMARHKDTTCARKPLAAAEGRASQSGTTAPSQIDQLFTPPAAPEGLVARWDEALAEVTLEWRPVVVPCLAGAAASPVLYRVQATLVAGHDADPSSGGSPVVIYLGPECRCRYRFPPGVAPGRVEARFVVVAMRVAESGPSAPATCTCAAVVFTYDHDMDERGLFYYIGTQGRTQPWQNPAEAGWVTATRSSDAEGKATDLTGRQPCHSSTGSNPTPAWWQVDLGAERLFTPTRYTLRHSNEQSSVSAHTRLQSWRLEGSVDGADGSWRTLDEHTNEPNAIPARADAMATFAVAPERAFPARRFRVLMTGPSPADYNLMMLSGLEMYGALLLRDPTLQQPSSQVDQPLAPPAAPEGLTARWDGVTGEVTLDWRPAAATAGDSAAAQPPMLYRVQADSLAGLDPTISSVIYTGECRCRYRVPEGTAPGRAEARFVVAAMRVAESGPSAPATCTCPAVVFTCDHDMDERGLFYYIGTQGRTQPWQNPAEAGWVTATRSHSCTKNYPNSWWRVDLGAERLFTPTRYTLRHSNTPSCEAYRLVSWRLEGSADGSEDSWRTLDEHTGEYDAIPREGGFTDFAVAPERAFPARRFRVLMTGPNYGDHHYLALAGLEMYGTLVAPSSPAPCSPPPPQLSPSVVFTFEHYTDEQGLFYYLGTRGRTQPFCNPAEAGWVTTTRSSDRVGKASDALGRQPCDSWTSDVPTPSWWQVDLGAGRLFTPTRYTLRHSNVESLVGHRLQAWRLEGSVDGGAHWRTLDEHITEEGNCLPECPDGTALFWVDPEWAFPARQFRLQMTGPNPKGCHFLHLAGLEMYGSLFLDPAPSSSSSSSTGECTV